MQGYILGGIIGIIVILVLMDDKLNRIEKALKEQHAPKQVAACKLT